MKIDIFKWIIGGLVAAIGFLGVFTSSLAEKVAKVQEVSITNAKDNDVQYKIIEKNTDKLNDVKGTSNENSLNFTHIKEDLTDIKVDIKELLKEMRSNKSS